MSDLRYCGTCNQRRYFVDGQCEMCTAFSRWYESTKLQRLKGWDEYTLARKAFEVGRNAKMGITALEILNTSEFHGSMAQAKSIAAEILVRQDDPDPMKYPDPLKRLGARLTELLDDDHWNNIEPLLHEIAERLLESQTVTGRAALREVLADGLELVESAFAHVSHGGPTRKDAEKWIEAARTALR